MREWELETLPFLRRIVRRHVGKPNVAIHIVEHELTSVGERRNHGAVQARQRVVEIERSRQQPAGLGQQRVTPHRLLGHLPGRLLASQLNAMGRLLADRLRFLVEIDKHADFGPHHFRVDGRRNKVHGAERVALGHLHVVVERRDENDRRMLRPFSLANQRGRLEAVHLGHVDVEQDHGEIVFKQTAQGLAPGVGLDDVLAKLLERGLDRHDLFRHVVDDEYVDWLASLHAKSFCSWPSAGGGRNESSCEATQRSRSARGTY